MNYIDTYIYIYLHIYIYTLITVHTPAYSMSFIFNPRRSLKLKAFLMNAEKESQAKDISISNVRYVHWIHPQKKLRWQWEIMILVGIRIYKYIHLQFFKCVVFPLSCQFSWVYFSVPMVWVCWEVSSFPFWDVLANQQLQVMDNEDMDVKALRWTAQFQRRVDVRVDVFFINSKNNSSCESGINIARPKKTTGGICFFSFEVLPFIWRISVLKCCPISTVAVLCSWTMLHCAPWCGSLLVMWWHQRRGY